MAREEPVLSAGLAPSRAARWRAGIAWSQRSYRGCGRRRARDGATVVSNFEICSWLGKKGVRALKPMNKGGTVQVGDVQITMVDAQHSSSYEDQGTMVYLGEAAGFILRAPGAPTVYFAGDTGLFGDMRLIAELYHPHIACLPIGGRVHHGSRASRARVRDAGRGAGAPHPSRDVPSPHRHTVRAQSARRTDRRAGARPQAGRDRSIESRGRRVTRVEGSGGRESQRGVQLELELRVGSWKLGVGS